MIKHRDNMASFTKEEIEEFIAEGSSPAFDPVCSDDEEDVAEKDNFNGWVDDDESEEFKSLFCSKKFQSIKALIAHDKEVFGFDLKAVVEAVANTDIAYIQLINFIRGTAKSWSTTDEEHNSALLENIKSLEHDILNNKSFLDEKNMIPQLEDDALLFLYEDEFSGFSGMDDN